MPQEQVGVGAAAIAQSFAAAAAACTFDHVLLLLQCPLASDSYGLGASLLGSLTVLVLKLNKGSTLLLMTWLGQLKPEVFAARIVR